MAIRQLGSQVGLERSPNIATVIDTTYLLAQLNVARGNAASGSHGDLTVLGEVTLDLEG
jgi:hypothetical protein